MPENLENIPATEPGDESKQPRKSLLAMSAAVDYRVLGTISPKMRANPNSTMAELMDDDQIAAYVQKEYESLRFILSHADNPDVPEHLQNYAKKHGPNLKETFLADIDYLRSINRLPKEFEDVEI